VRCIVESVIVIVKDRDVLIEFLVNCLLIKKKANINDIDKKVMHLKNLYYFFTKPANY